MLTHLSIQNLAVVEQLELSFQAGMTVFTGETGAGKSILIDALSLTLGNRADSTLVRADCASAQVTAIYDVKGLPSVIDWLQTQGLTSDPQTECIIRRCITMEGRSRAYINGSAVPLNQLKDLGEQLVNIHSQHQHHALLRPEVQRALLDDYGNHQELCALVREAYFAVQKLYKAQKELLSLQGQQDKLALLQYQIQELQDLNLNSSELPQLEVEHRKLTHAGDWLTQSNTVLSALENDDNDKQSVRTTLHQILPLVAALKQDMNTLDSCHELLSQALIHINEAIDEVNQFKDGLCPDPERLAAIEARFAQIHALSRKHRISGENLSHHLHHLQTEAAKLTDVQTALNDIQGNIDQAEHHYQTLARQLSEARQKTRLPLEILISEKMHSLEMPKGQFQIQITPIPDKIIHLDGIDDIEFLVSTNPGLPLQPLRKVASGGELSRLSLAIQVITAEKMTTPTLIFDEVDVGISGKTAEIVGQLLRELSHKTQVLCVTHLPQVAAQGHHHFKVEKQQTEATTSTTLHALNKTEKIQEIARLLGGVKITKNTLAHANEMLEMA